MGAWEYCPRPRTPYFFNAKNFLAYKYTLYGISIHFKSKNFREKTCLTKQYDLRLGSTKKWRSIVSRRLHQGPIDEIMAFKLTFSTVIIWLSSAFKL